MSETVYNVFLPFDGGDLCDHALYVGHDTTLDDEAALQFLKDRVEADLENAVRVPIAKPFSRATYYARCRIGEGHHLYDEVFEMAGARVAAPLAVTTLVVDGKVKVDISCRNDDPNFYLCPEAIGDAHMDDWLLKYRAGDTLDLPRLIHDDYFLAIKLTFNAKLYVSSLKLLLSCIDSISYIEFGDQKASFIRWLHEYADLEMVGVTPEELWELRNGVLHMTNLSSRQVTQKKVRRISIRIGGEEETDADGTYLFSFYGLIQAFAAALQKWLASYNEVPGKFAVFVERYDETISDSRLLWRPSLR